MQPKGTPKMRGQSNVLMISNSIKELRALIPHLELPGLIDLGAHTRSLAGSLRDENKKTGLDDVIATAIKTRIGPAELKTLVGNPRIERGGVFQAVYSASSQSRFDQSAFKSAYPELYQKFCKPCLVATLSYKPRG